MALKWTAQLSVTPPAQTQKLPGDKISLPPSALEQLLAAAPSITTDAPRAVTSQFDPFNPYTFVAERRARELTAERQQQLPHPLTFRLVNPDNGRVVHAGIREFSSDEGEIGLSPLLYQSLGFRDSDFPRHKEDIVDVDEPGESVIAPRYPKVTVHAVQLSKGTYVRLRPLEAGYDVEDWKALLERHLRDNFTTLTVGEVLPVPSGRNDTFRFLVDKVQPEGDAICVVDTDLEVDIEALDEEQARETLRRQLAKSKTVATSGSSAGGILSQGDEKAGQVLQGDYVDYELRDWERKKPLEIELSSDGDVPADLFISPFSSRQRSKPRNNQYVFGDFSNTHTKHIQLRPSNVELEGAESLFISVYLYHPSNPNKEGDEQLKATKFRLRATLAEELQLEAPKTEDETMHDEEDVQCKNCRQWIPNRTLFLHENFCFRNNIACPKCQNVFQRRSPEWENHWHCDHDDAHGNDDLSKLKHEEVFHMARPCPACGFQTTSLPELAQHRTTTCPAKPILCQFCHLEVPQKGDGDPDFLDPEVLLSGLTPHEIIDGGRTTECHLCNKIIRLRDMKTHLKHHELDRMSRPPPRICINPNCSRTIDGAGHKPGRTADNSLGLCGTCFGPLYADLYDPEGKSLRRRIERRYLSQMLTGCGKLWCRNEYCKTGRANLSNVGSEKALENPSVNPKDALALVKPLIEAVSVRPGLVNTAPLFFCTDETTQHRRTMADMLAIQEDGQYESGWCIAAVEFTSGNLEKAHEWLGNWAPKKSEMQ